MRIFSDGSYDEEGYDRFMEDAIEQEANEGMEDLIEEIGLEKADALMEEIEESGWDWSLLDDYLRPIQVAAISGNQDEFEYLWRKKCEESAY